MQGRPYQVGITGGIGSGKSTVVKIFSVLGIPHYSADERARWLMENSLPLIDKLKKTFGKEAYHESKVNREYLAKEVFNNKSSLEALNELVHPAVAEDYEAWVAKHSQSSYLLKEAALLIESGSYKTLDELIHVYSPMDLREERIMQRDPFRSREEIKKIILTQLSDEQRDELSSLKIINDEKTPLIPQVLAIHHKLIQTLTRES